MVKTYEKNCLKQETKKKKILSWLCVQYSVICVVKYASLIRIYSLETRSYYGVN